MTTEPDDGGLVPLADGPVAAVLAGVDATTGEAFALKVFPGPLDRRTRAALEAELGRLSALRPQAPILVADRVEALPDGRCALRMELCAQALPDLIESFGPLSVPDTLVLGTVLAATLATAHRAGFVHGGVTPGNVLFRSSGEPVLSDFGRTLRDAFPRDPLPTVELMAPETVRDGTTDERTDLYGLGVILHCALSGRHPHHGPRGVEQGERLLRVLGTPVPPIERADAPAELIVLVSALLAKDPDARPAAAATVAERLDTLRRQTAPPAEEAAPPAEATALPDEATAPPDPSTAPSIVDQQPDPLAFDDFATPAPPHPAVPASSGPAAPAPSGPAAPASSGPGVAASSGPAVPVSSGPAVPASPGLTVPASSVSAAPVPRGKPILVFGPKRPPWRTSRAALLSAAAGVVTLLVTATVLLVMSRPDELALPTPPAQSGAASPSPTPTRAVRLELADPTDRGNIVELSWSSSEPMDFAVIVAAEGVPTRTLFVRRNTTHSVPVDPVRKYCFRIQATDGVNAVESAPKPIRGAKCVT